ncbi:MAG: oligosaccharide repeat unit polymerase [Candidatus Binatia bacterium]
MAIAYSGIVVAFGTTVVASRDVFNPLCFVLFIGIVRYSCPAFLLLVGVEPPEDIAQFYRLMRLSDSDWPWAHVLALTSLAGIVLGWFLLQSGTFQTSRLNFSFPAGISHAALFGMLVGGAALVVFIVKNVSLGAIVTGAIRNATIQEGTGVYFRFIYMAIAGSILLSAYLLERNRRRIALIPVLACTVVLLTLGGRGRAITPLAAGLLLQWYRNRERHGWAVLHVKIKYIIAGLFVGLLATWLFHFVALYRGGHGLSAFGQSVSLQGIWEYLQYSMFVEFGHLHSLAGAVVIGPGVLGGQTFLGTLTFPLSKLLPIPGRSAGVYIVETLVGFHSEDRWGLHASLIGDAYLNFGVIGIMLIMPLFGMLMKLLYAKFRKGTLNAALYAFATVYGLNLFLKSIEAWPHMLVGLVFIVVITRLSVLFNFRQRVFG